MFHMWQSTFSKECILLRMFSQHGYIDCIHPPPHNSLTAEKAREILMKVKETQETFKKQQERIKLEAEVCNYAHVTALCL